jgi:hypothetical protein
MDFPALVIHPGFVPRFAACALGETKMPSEYVLQSPGIDLFHLRSPFRKDIFRQKPKTQLRSAGCCAIVSPSQPPNRQSSSVGDPGSVVQRVQVLL